jgi:hypothetical protein
MSVLRWHTETLWFDSLNKNSNLYLAGTSGSSGVPEFEQTSLQRDPGELPQSLNVQESQWQREASHDPREFRTACSRPGYNHQSNQTICWTQSGQHDTSSSRGSRVHASPGQSRSTRTHGRRSYHHQISKVISKKARQTWIRADNHETDLRDNTISSLPSEHSGTQVSGTALQPTRLAESKYFSNRFRCDNGLHAQPWIGWRHVGRAGVWTSDRLISTGCIIENANQQQSRTTAQKLYQKQGHAV